MLVGNHYGVSDRNPDEIAQRRLLVVQRRVEGWAYGKIREEIRAKFGYTVSEVTLAEDFKLVMKQRAKELHESTDAIRQAITERLDMATAAIIDRVAQGSLDHIEMLLKIDSQRAKLLGVNKETGGPPPNEKPRLSEGEIRAKILRISERLNERKSLTEGAIDAEIVAAPLRVDNPEQGSRRD